MLRHWIALAMLPVSASACATTSHSAYGENFTKPGFDRIPQAEPTKTVSLRGDQYDLFISEKPDGTYITRVCVRYVQTGSRLERNTCSHGTANNVVGVNYRGVQINDTSRHTRLTEDARFVAITATRMLNGTVEIEDLEGELEEAMRNRPADLQRRQL